MAELRWNPLLRTWTMVATNRQNRPNLPKNYCPFCPESGKVPKDYDVFAYPNDFPSLSRPAPSIAIKADGFYKVAENYGHCEVILYSPKHNASLHDLSLEHLTKLVQLWGDRFDVLAKDKGIQYIFPFENRGEEVGVTQNHPHGQLYAYPFVPLKVRAELDSCKEHYEENGTCLLCDMNAKEQAIKERIVFENEHFTSYIPFFTDYPYGVYIVSKGHKGTISVFDKGEKEALAEMLKNITGAFDTLFGRRFPYMMCIYQTPVNCSDYEGAEAYYHFHIEFYPPLRAKHTIKHNASSETGGWAAANTLAVEDTAGELRDALKRFCTMV